MEKQRYGLGQQDFKILRESEAVYVDKTHFIPELLNQHYYFLSRPRRFGKSLLVSTLQYFFQGRRELFQGLAIDNYDWDWQEYPVIRIDLSEGDFSTEEGLRIRWLEIMAIYETKFGVLPKGESPRARFNNLIFSLFQKFNRQVVILIDEYEKPLLDAIEKPYFDKVVNELSAIYSVFKSNSEYIRFLFLTGITRFGHLNIFSGLNNLKDISLNPAFEAICGITQKEISEYLLPGVDRYSQHREISQDDALKVLKEYYDGYHFSENLEDIYNPYTLLYCLDTLQLLPMWVATGMTSSLLYLIKNRDWDLSQIEDIQADPITLLGVDAEFLAPTTLFYQTGYLTIKSYDKTTGLFRLGIPNQEVRQSLYKAIIPYYVGKDIKLQTENVANLGKFIREGNADEMMRWLQSFFSKIPSEMKMRLREDKPRAEKDFQFVVYMIFSQVCSLSRLHLEYSNSAGRSDMVIETKDCIYIIEFKLGSTAQKALQQIEEKGYALPWQSSGKKVIKIGCTFSARSKGLLQFKIATE